MSISQTQILPIFTIEVGSKNTYTNDSNINIVPALNAEILSAPKGYQINIIFNPGVYGEGSGPNDKPILLPSNTSVIGNDATLEFINSGGQLKNMMANADAYNNSYGFNINNTNGTSVLIPYNPVSTDYLYKNDTLGSPIIDTNISVKGMTFDDRNGWFATWFINGTNIDIQDNTYIGGMDSAALLNVVNAVDANNISVGATNAAYDNWNGPVNTVIENNVAFTGRALNTGWAVLLNSTPTGYLANPGNAVNDAIVGNLFASNYDGSSASNADPILSYGTSTETNITQQGNVDSVLNSTNPQGFYEANVNNTTVQDNLVSQSVATANSNANTIEVLGSSSNSNISGNLIIGAVFDGTSPLIQNSGIAPITSNNAILGQNSSQLSTISASSTNNISKTGGNIISSNNTLTGSGVTPNLSINATPTLFAPINSTISLSNLTINDIIQGSIETVTLMSQFGRLSLPSTINATQSTISGEQAIIITGNQSIINTDLSLVSYTGNSSGWDDSIEISAVDTAGVTAMRYIPVIVPNVSVNTSNNVITLPPGLIAPPSEQVMYPGQTLPPQVLLTGDIIIAAAGDNNLNMDTTTSIAFLGSGQNTLEGGSNPEYITTGLGKALLNLDRNGDITIAGGAGSMIVQANTGNNLIECGSSEATISSGSGSNTIACGLGNACIQGGNGPLYLATLPQDGGNFNGKFGSGNSTIYALSGNNVLSTQNITTNIIYLGLGNNSISSAGSDVIHLGAGAVTINILQSGCDTVYGGTGPLTLIGQSNSSLLVPLIENQVITVEGFSDIKYYNSPTVVAGSSTQGLITFINTSSQTSGLLGGLNIVSDTTQVSGNIVPAVNFEPLVNPSFGLQAFFSGNKISAGGNSTLNFLQNQTGEMISNNSSNQIISLDCLNSDTVSGSTIPGMSHDYFFNAPSSQSDACDIVTNFDMKFDRAFINPFGNDNIKIIALSGKTDPLFGTSSLISLSDGARISLLGVTSSALGVSIVGGTSF